MLRESHPILEVENLCTEIDGYPILRGVNLTVYPGEIHAIMGPNGAGKSTFAKAIGGHPQYEVSKGSIRLHGKELNELDPDERAHLGLFMSFQYPIEIPGVSNSQFLRVAYNAKRKFLGERELPAHDFNEILESKMQLIEMRSEFKERNVNEGFSGGEKKRNEILQMAVLEPKLAILDETDSGLDIDAMRIVSRGVNRIMHNGMGLILITHYQRLLDYIRPTYVHVMIDGKLVETGGPELALELEEKGYDWLIDRGAA